jgi:hypothetical protein
MATDESAPLVPVALPDRFGGPRAAGRGVEPVLHSTLDSFTISRPTRSGRAAPRCGRTTDEELQAT